MRQRGCWQLNCSCCCCCCWNNWTEEVSRSTLLINLDWWFCDAAPNPLAEQCQASDVMVMVKGVLVVQAMFVFAVSNGKDLFVWFVCSIRMLMERKSQKFREHTRNADNLMDKNTRGTLFLLVDATGRES